MKSVLRIGMILFLSMMVTGLFAQQRGGGMRNRDPNEQAKQQLEQMKGIITIEKKEEAKITEIFVNAAKERQKAFEGMQQGGDREGMREITTNLNKKRDEKLKEVLGEKRMETYLKELEKLRQQRRDGQRRL